MTDASTGSGVCVPLQLTPEEGSVNPGDDLDCSELNALPDPKPPTEMPTERTPISSPIALEGGARFTPGTHGSSDGGLAGVEYAPALDPDLVEFTRPPLLPGADVSSIPPPDSCAGCLGAATSTTEIGLIRMPHVATWFDTTDLDDSSVFSQEETTYISFSLYGSAVGTDRRDQSSARASRRQGRPGASAGDPRCPHRHRGPVAAVRTPDLPVGRQVAAEGRRARLFDGRVSSEIGRVLSLGDERWGSGSEYPGRPWSLRAAR